LKEITNIIAIPENGQLENMKALAKQALFTSGSMLLVVTRKGKVFGNTRLIADLKIKFRTLYDEYIQFAKNYLAKFAENQSCYRRWRF